MLSSKEKFEHFVDLHYEKLYHFSLKMVRNESDAQDILQDALFKAYTHFEHFKEGYSFTSWVYKIILRVHLDQHRSLKSGTFIVSYDQYQEGHFHNAIDMPDKEPNPEEILLNHFNEQEYLKDLDTLKSSHKDILYLADYEKKSYLEIASELCIPLNTVRSRLHRARKALECSSKSKLMVQ